MSYRQVIRDQNFVKLWLSQIFSLIAQSLLNFALIIRIFDLTRGGHFANIAVAILILAIGIPAVLFSSAAGVYADHWDRKGVLVVSNFFRTVLVLGFLVFEHNLWLVLIMAFLVSSATQFFAPAEAAAIPMVSKPSNLIKANGLFVTTLYATFVIGYSASAPVIKLLGPQAPYLLASGFFGIATLLAVVLPPLGGRQSGHLQPKQLWRQLLQDMKRGRQLVASDPKLKQPVIQLMLVQAVISIILTLAPALSLALIKQPIQDASVYLIIPAAVGMALGVLTVGQLAHHFPKPTVTKAGLVLTGLILTLLGLSGLLYRVVGGHVLAHPIEVERIVAALLLLFGASLVIISVSAQTLLHEVSDENMRGAVFGILYTLINLAATAPVLLAGILADVLSVTKVVMLCGAGVLIYAATQYYKKP